MAHLCKSFCPKLVARKKLGYIVVGNALLTGTASLDAVISWRSRVATDGALLKHALQGEEGGGLYSRCFPRIHGNAQHCLVTRRPALQQHVFSGV